MSLDMCQIKENKQPAFENFHINTNLTMNCWSVFVNQLTGYWLINRQVNDLILRRLDTVQIVTLCL